LGAMLYEMIAGRRAFEGMSRASLIAAIMKSDPPPLKPAAVDAIVRRCLAKNPASRFQTASEVQAALQQYVERPRFDVRWVYAAAAIAVIVALLGVLLARR